MKSAARERRKAANKSMKFAGTLALILYANAWAAKEPVGIPISYMLDKDGQVSLAVYDGEGRLLREILRAEPQEAGPHTVVWDGLKQDGTAVEPGTCQWRVLRTPGLTTRYVMMLGTNGTPDYADWPGDHAGPSAVLVDGDDMYVGARAGETVPVLIKQNLAGTKRYWQLRAKGVLRMRMDEGRLYVLQVTGEVLIIDPSTGGEVGTVVLTAPKMQFDFNHNGSATAPGWKPVAVQEYTKANGYGWDNIKGITSIDRHLGDPMLRDFHAWNVSEMRSFLIDIPYGRYTLRMHYGDSEADHEQIALWIGAKQQPLNPVSVKAGEFKTVQLVTHSDWGKNGTLDIGFRNLPGAKPDCIINGIEILDSWARMDVRDGLMVACFPNSNLVQWIDARTGDVLDKAGVEAPRDIRFAVDGTVLVLLDNRIASISQKDHKLVDRIAGLTKPVAMNVDQVLGDILVAESGDSQRVKRFSKDYELRQIYGAQGGRPAQGLYDQPTSFLNIENVAGDGRGGFLVSESGVAPRRTSHFRADGTLIREWYGGQQFFQHTCPDPEDPNVLWLDSEPGWVMQVVADYEAKTWKVRATYEFAELGAGLMSRKRGSGRWCVAHRGGQTYLWSDFACPPFILRVDEPGRRLVPVAAGGNVGTVSTISACPQPWLDALAHSGYDIKDPKVRRNHTGWTWADSDGDGILDAEEFRLAEKGARVGGVVHLDDKWNVYFGLRGDGPAYGMMPNLGWTSCGAPLWDWSKVRMGPDLGLSGDVSAVFCNGQDDVYLTLKGQDEGFRHGERWSADLFDVTSFVKLDANGLARWLVGPHAARRDGPKGMIHDPVRILGEARGCVFVGERVIRPLEVWTTDGLYVGGAFDRRADDGLPDRVYHWFHVNWSEFGNEAINKTTIQYDCLAGGAIHAWPDGRVFWYAPGWNMNPVYELSGWDGWQRREGKLPVDRKPITPVKAGQGLKGEYFANVNLEGQPVLTRRDDRIWLDWGEGSVDGLPSNRSSMGNTPVSPTSLVPRDNFSVRWTGSVEAPLTEEFVFTTYNNDGIRVWLDGEKVIDDWNEWDGTVLYQYTKYRKLVRRHSRPIRLVAAQRYALKVEYYEDGTVQGRAQPNSEAHVHLCWESLTLHRQHIPKELLYPPQE